MNNKTRKGSIWKREILRFGELSIPVWALISMLFVSVTAAASVVIYNAVVAQVVQPANVLPPISISLYTGNYISGTFNTLVTNSVVSANDNIQVSGGNAIIYGVNTINNANREVNTTLIDIITANPSVTSNALLPITVYYLGSSYNAIYVPNSINLKTSNSLQADINTGNFLNILNSLQTGALGSGFYTYNVPGKSYLNPGSNAITVTNWIGSQAYNFSTSNDTAYYYLLNQSDLTGTANTLQVGMPSIPANAFRYYPSGVQPSSVIGFVVPSSFNGSMDFTLKAIASSRALTK